MFNLRQFKELSTKEQTAVIENILNSHNIDDLMQEIMDKGHSLKMHCGQSPEAMVERTMTEMHETSFFIDEEEAKNFIENALYIQREDIAKWLASDYREPSLVMSVYYGEEVGRGVDMDFKEKTTDHLTIKLDRDLSYDSSFGFKIVTAYPNITKEDCQYTGKTYENIYKDTLNKMENNLCKGYWQLRTAGFNPKTYMIDTTKIVTVDFVVNGERFSCNFNDYSSKLRLKDTENDKWHTVKKENVSKEIAEKYQDIVNAYYGKTKEKTREENAETLHQNER